MLHRSLYGTLFDFPIDHSHVSAGDLTAQMALPWQADFLQCTTRGCRVCESTSLRRLTGPRLIAGNVAPTGRTPS